MRNRVPPACLLALLLAHGGGGARGARPGVPRFDFVNREPRTFLVDRLTDLSVAPSPLRHRPALM